MYLILQVLFMSAVKTQCSYFIFIFSWALQFRKETSLTQIHVPVNRSCCNKRVSPLNSPSYDVHININNIKDYTDLTSTCTCM